MYKPTLISNELFDELKRASIKIWRGYDDTYGYASEKIAYVESITNISDNWGTFIGMFDSSNQRKLYAIVSPEAQKLIRIWNGWKTGYEAL